MNKKIHLFTVLGFCHWRSVDSLCPSCEESICRSAGGDCSTTGISGGVTHRELHLLISPPLCYRWETMRPFLLLSCRPMLKSLYCKLQPSGFEAVITDAEIIWSVCSCWIYFALQPFIRLLFSNSCNYMPGKSKNLIKAAEKNSMRLWLWAEDE